MTAEPVVAAAGDGPPRRRSASDRSLEGSSREGGQADMARGGGRCARTALARQA